MQNGEGIEALPGQEMLVLFDRRDSVKRFDERP